MHLQGAIRILGEQVLWLAFPGKVGKRTAIRGELAA